MAKEKFQRTKPHVNVGLIVGSVLMLSAAGIAAALLSSTGSLTRDRNGSTATPTSQAEDSGSGEQARGPLLEQMTASLVMVLDECNGPLPGLQVSYALHHGGEEPVSPGRTGPTIILMLFEGSTDQNGRFSTDLSTLPKTWIVPYYVTQSGQVPPDSGGAVSYRILLHQHHPDFAWVPTFNPTGVDGGSGDSPEGSAAHGEVLYFPEEMLAEIKDEAVLLLVHIPEVPGLFKDTADGVQFTGDQLQVAGALVTSTDEAEQVGNAYRLEISGSGPPLVPNTLILNVPENAVGEPGIPRANVSVFVEDDHGRSPAQYNISDFAFLNELPSASGFQGVDGLSFEHEVIEFDQGQDCLPTRTPTGTTNPAPTPTPTPTNTLAPALPAPTETPEPPRAPSRTPTPEGRIPPSSPTATPRTPRPTQDPAT